MIARMKPIAPVQSKSPTSARVAEMSGSILLKNMIGLWSRITGLSNDGVSVRFPFALIAWTGKNRSVPSRGVFYTASRALTSGIDCPTSGRQTTTGARLQRVGGAGQELPHRHISLQTAD